MIKNVRFFLYYSEDYFFDLCIKSDEKSWSFLLASISIDYTSQTGMCIFINQLSSKGDENGNLKQISIWTSRF